MELRCDVCDLEFESIYSLWSHTKKHKINWKVCNICNKAYKYEKSLRTHMFNIHNISDGIRRYRCTLCIHSAVNIADLNTHIKNHHPYAGNVSVSCPDCGLICRGINFLLKHYIMDHPINSYKCPKCGVSFKSRLVTAMHLKLHADNTI